MSQTSTTTRRELLPEDVVEDIMGHLPVKSSTRFRGGGRDLQFEYRFLEKGCNIDGDLRRPVITTFSFCPLTSMMRASGR
nr:hypothetical protein CFP56_63635 [Quercus suber]